ncbi:MAG: hypothetical protein KDG50_00435 [Chromatiales bacterium]|nr:hypothetical protein [Chromatiales bacterium]
MRAPRNAIRRAATVVASVLLLGPTLAVAGSISGDLERHLDVIAQKLTESGLSELVTRDRDLSRTERDEIVRARDALTDWLSGPTFGGDKLGDIERANDEREKNGATTRTSVSWTPPNGEIHLHLSNDYECGTGLRQVRIVLRISIAGPDARGRYQVNRIEEMRVTRVYCDRSRVTAESRLFTTGAGQLAVRATPREADPQAQSERERQQAAAAAEARQLAADVEYERQRKADEARRQRDAQQARDRVRQQAIEARNQKCQQCEELKRQLAAARGRLQRVEGDMTAKDAEVNAKNAEIGRVRGQIAALEGQLSATTGDWAESTDPRTGVRIRSVGNADGSHTIYRWDARGRPIGEPERVDTGNRERLQQRLAGLRTTLQRLTGERDRLAAEWRRLRDRRHEIRDEIGRLERELAECMRSCDKQSRDLGMRAPYNTPIDRGTAMAPADGWVEESEDAQIALLGTQQRGGENPFAAGSVGQGPTLRGVQPEPREPVIGPKIQVPQGGDPNLRQEAIEPRDTTVVVRTPSPREPVPMPMPSDREIMLATISAWTIGIAHGANSSDLCAAMDFLYSAALARDLMGSVLTVLHTDPTGRSQTLRYPLLSPDTRILAKARIFTYGLHIMRVLSFITPTGQSVQLRGELEGRIRVDATEPNRQVCSQ